MKKEDPGSSFSGAGPVRRIGITFNLKKKDLLPGESDDRYEEYDCLETIETLEREIKQLGFETERYEQDEPFSRGSPKPSRLRLEHSRRPRDHKGRESQVPSVLRAGDPLFRVRLNSHSRHLDKWLTHHVLAGGAAVPDLYMFSAEKDLGVPCPSLKSTENTSSSRDGKVFQGVFADSVVDNPVDMADRVRRIWKNYNQPALVEEFLPGVEITVGIMGNRNPAVIG